VALLFFTLSCRDITERHRRLAEIIEMIHTASLVHDDVLDDCSVRRGGCLQQYSCAQHCCCVRCVAVLAMRSIYPLMLLPC
jgi:geranylgeranyl pyrophosphate synthase